MAEAKEEHRDDMTSMNLSVSQADVQSRLDQSAEAAYTWESDVAQHQRYTSVAVENGNTFVAGDISMAHQFQAQLPLNSQSDLIDSGLGSAGAEDNHGTQFFPGFTVQHDRGHDQELLEPAANAPRPRAVQHEVPPEISQRPRAVQHEVPPEISQRPRAVQHEVPPEISQRPRAVQHEVPPEISQRPRAVQHEVPPEISQRPRAVQHEVPPEISQRPRAVQHEELSPAVAARPVTAHNEVLATAAVVPRPVVVAQETNSSNLDVNLWLVEMLGTNLPFPLPTDIRIHDDHHAFMTGDVDLRAARMWRRHLTSARMGLLRCATCFQRPRQTINLPCMCFCNCLECGQVMEVCAMCQRGIEAFAEMHILQREVSTDL